MKQLYVIEKATEGPGLYQVLRERRLRHAEVRTHQIEGVIRGRRAFTTGLPCPIHGDDHSAVLLENCAEPITVCPIVYMLWCARVAMDRGTSGKFLGSFSAEKFIVPVGTERRSVWDG